MFTEDLERIKKQNSKADFFSSNEFEKKINTIISGTLTAPVIME